MILAPTLTLSAGSGAAIVRPTFSRDFAGEKTLNNGTGPAITFTRASNATFFDANGVLQTASNDQPRFDHDPATGASRGLLIEEARTNLLVRSAEFDDSGWSKQNATIQANSVVAPDGTLTGDKLIDDTTNGFHRVFQTPATPSGAITLSFYAKAAERSWAFARINDDTNTARNAFFDISNGVVGNFDTGYTLDIINAGNGWYRCIATIASNTSTGIFSFGCTTGNGTATYTGDGTSGLFIWGAQLEAGAFPTSYIPTTTAAATRSADSAVVTPISSFYNQSEGTLFAEGIGVNNIQSLVTRRFAEIGREDALTASERIIVGYNTIAASRFVIVDEGAVQADIQVVQTMGNTTVKIAGGYASSSFQQATNGTLGAADTSGSAPSVTHLSIGHDPLLFAGTSINGHIRKVAYWPKRLSNTLLQQLTT